MKLLDIVALIVVVRFGFSSTHSSKILISGQGFSGYCWIKSRPLFSHIRHMEIHDSTVTLIEKWPCVTEPKGHGYPTESQMPYADALCTHRFNRSTEPPGQQTFSPLLFINWVRTHTFNLHTHIHLQLLCLGFSSILIWSMIPNSQPYAANFNLGRGPCSKWMQAAAAKSTLKGIC